MLALLIAMFLTIAVTSPWGRAALSADAAPAWIQAIGSLLAIVVVAAVAIHESRSRSRERQEDQRERKLTAMRARSHQRDEQNQLRRDRWNGSVNEILGSAQEFRLHIDHMHSRWRIFPIPGITWKSDRVLLEDMLRRLGDMTARAPTLALQTLIVDQRRLLAKVYAEIHDLEVSAQANVSSWAEWKEEANRLFKQVEMMLRR